MKKIRSAIAPLIKELEEACRRPLFVEIVSHRRSDATENPQVVSGATMNEMETTSRASSDRPNVGKQLIADDKKQTRSWQEVRGSVCLILFDI